MPSSATCLTNTATITGNELDPTSGNNSGSQTACPTNAVIDVAKAAGTVTNTGGTNYTATYTVTVGNTGSTTGTYTQVTDVPRYAAGARITGVTWSGGPTGAGSTTATPVGGSNGGTDTGYLIGTTAAKSIAAGATHPYTVTVAFTVDDPTALTACSTPPSGLYNQVALPEETPTSSSTNNAACLDPPAQLNVVKTAGAVTGPADDGTYTVGYTLTVANSASVQGMYGPLTDTLSFDPNLTPLSATWSRTDQNGATGSTTFTAAPYTTTVGAANTAIAAGATHTYSLSVVYRLTGTLTGADTLSACAGPGTGLYNAAALPTGQESGATTDNSACVTPPTPTPQIALDKTGTDTDGQPVETLTAPADVTYRYTVTNPGNEPLRDVTVTDDTCEPVTYDSGDTNTDQLLQVDETWTFTCTATVLATTTNTATTRGVGVASGRETTDDDTWTVTMTPREIRVRKLDSAGAALAGARFALYDTDPTVAGATPIASGIALDPAQADGSVFLSTGLQFGRPYWLVETGSPAGHQLLAGPVAFTVTGTGIELGDAAANAPTVQLAADDSFALSVTDTPANRLPAARGTGRSLAVILLGLLLAGAGFVTARRTLRPDAQDER